MAQAIQQSKRRFSIPAVWIAGIAVAVAIVLLAVFSSVWLPWAQSLLASLKGSGQQTPAATNEAVEDHGDHSGHNHAGHAEEDSVELSIQARKNIGLETRKLVPSTFVRTVSVPGIVVERPGRSLLEVTAPLTGVVKEIFAIQGEAIKSGQKLFEIRLTHEEVVQAQSDMLRTVEELVVNDREIERLKKVTADGGVPGKMLLERQYEQQKQQAILRAQRQTLLLHGLSKEQVDQIEKDRTLLQTLTVYAPRSSDESRVLQLEALKIAQGQHVNAGTTLAVLTDHAELFIEGNAFERDADEINRAAAEDLAITAFMQVDEDKPQTVPDLRILYVSSQIDVDTRTLHFYVVLPNEKLGERSTDGHRFVAWRYRTGQRMQLQVPVETWQDRFVVPVNAIAQEGPETYVFTVNGDHFDRRPVHVEFRDAAQVVIANDGSVFPGDEVAISGAQQLQLALKNKAGGGIDPHAGHNH
jgi:multidrug efflux pump subunit AcrA (membrane-fusion protein)